MSYLGISAGFHDASISVIDNDGNIVYAGHSERYSKQKNDHTLNEDIFSAGLGTSVITDIAYYEKPFLKQLRRLYQGSGFDFKQACTQQILANSIPQIAKKRIGTGYRTHSYPHHKSHAAAGFQTSPYQNATVVVIDAIGEFDTITIWHAEYNSKGKAKYKKLWSQGYPHSMGLFYSAMTQRVGLKPNEDEYILMGMAGYGVPDYKVFDEFVDNREQVRFKNNLHAGCLDWKTDLSDFNIAASAQYTLEVLLHSVITRARKIGRSNNLVYMGGVALNCSANEHLGAYYDNIWIMPNPGDAGSSLGAAALAYGKKINWQHPFLGTDIPGDYPVNEILDQLLTKKIVGVASGRAEFGPRALGNRSLLADPRGREIKDQVNKIKRRQKFRPFAPVILEEYVDNYFIMPQGFPNSPYMQVVARLKDPDSYPAVVHTDGTSRVQTVPKDSNSGIRQLLEKWFVLTGCPMLLNTSLNVKGKPMVNDRVDADEFEQLYGVKVCS
jgi:carbamoyltransferase